MKIGVIAAFAEQMRNLRAAAFENAVLDAPTLVLLGVELPPRQVRAVEELHPAGLLGRQLLDLDLAEVHHGGSSPKLKGNAALARKGVEQVRCFLTVDKG